MTSYTPTDELVACAWLKTCPLLSGVSVATTLAAQTTWDGPTFIQVESSPLGVPPHPNFPSHNPRIMANCWARPKRYADAGDLAQLIRSETYRLSSARVLHINGYADVRIMSVQILEEPTRITGDPNSLARYSFPLHMEWIEIEVPILQ